MKFSRHRTIPVNAINGDESRVPKGVWIDRATLDCLRESVSAALLFSQLEFRQQKYADDEGWFSYTRDEIARDTSLGIAAQLTALRVLTNHDLVEVRLSGMPRRAFYRLAGPQRLVIGDPNDKPSGMPNDKPSGRPHDKPLDMPDGYIKKRTDQTNYRTENRQTDSEGDCMKSAKKGKPVGHTPADVIAIKTRRAPVKKAEEPKEKKEPWAAPFAESFKLAYAAQPKPGWFCYGLPYGDTPKDYVQLAKLKKRLGDLLTPGEWREALKHYFRTPQGKHSLADLASRYDTFRLYSLNKFKQPVRNQILSEKGQANLEAGQRAADKINQNAIAEMFEPELKKLR